MSDFNNESMAIWKALKPMIDKEIKMETKGTVQRRKAKVTTAPSLSNGTIGVTEPFGDEHFIPFTTNLSTAKVGDVVWVEFMYGATNAFASMYAAADTKDWTVGGLLDVVQRRCAASLSSPGWYRVCDVMFGAEGPAKGSFGFVVAFNIVRRGSSTSAESHAITYRAVNNGNGKFIGEESVGFYNNQPYVSKIRYTYDGDGNGHFDIYYELSAANNVTVFYDAYVTLGSRSAFVANSLTSVASAPAGETIVTLYDFINIGVGEISCSNLSASGTVNGQGFYDLLLGVGNEIASNTDCDTLTAEGKYTCGSSSIASTLSNSPFSAAFGMFVFRVATGDRKVQIAIPNSTTITIKIRYYNGSTWTTWKTLTPI